MSRKISLGLICLTVPLAFSFGADVTGSGDLYFGWEGNNTYVRGLYGAAVPGPSSVIFGNSSAAGSYSGALGYGHAASGHHAFAIGYGNAVLANHGNALGNSLYVNSYGMVAVGTSNAYQTSGFSLTGWEADDLLFVVGNGPISGARSNALEIYKNGNLIANGADNRLPLQTTLPDNASILTRTLGDSRYFLNTLGQISLGQFAVGDPNAVLLVGNGASMGSPATSLKLFKNGNIETPGTLNVTGSTTVAGLTAGSTSLTSLGVSGVAGFSGSVAVTGVTSTMDLNAAKTWTEGTSSGTLVSATATFNPTVSNGYRLTALRGRAQSAGAQNLTRSIGAGGGLSGAEGWATHGGSGVVTSAIATSGVVTASSTGNIGSSIAIFARTPSVSGTGTVGDAYGVYIENQKGTGVTGKGYGIYSVGANTINAFEGRMRVGGLTDPAAGIALDVTGNVAFSGNLTGSGTDNKLPNQTLTGGTSILTRDLADALYLTSSGGGQIVLGANHAAVSGAVITVGNGAPGSPSNAVLVTNTGEATFASLASAGNFSASGANNLLPNQQLTADESIVTRELGDARYLRNNNGQIIVGNHQVADPNAAIIVANGADAQNPHNAFVVKSNGTVEVESIEVKPNGVIRVPQSGDISMGAYN